MTYSKIPARRIRSAIQSIACRRSQFLQFKQRERAGRA